MTYKCPDCGHGINFNHQGCKIKMTLTKLIELQAAATTGPWGTGDFQDTGFVNQRSITPVIGCVYGDESDTAANASLIAAARNFDFAALDAKIKRYEDALRLIACRPLGGKTEDYLCASGLQQLARKALEGME